MTGVATRLRLAGGLALLIAYPILVHVAVVAHSRNLTFAALASLILGSFWPRLRRPNVVAALNLIVALVAAALVAFFLSGVLLFYAAPICALTGLLSVFAASLLPGRTPVATRAAEAVRGSCPPEVRRYTRGVTVFWCGVFGALIAENIVLVLFASPAVWSLFANGVNYLVVAAAFIGELVWRQKSMADDVEGDWLDQIRPMLHIDWSQVMRSRG
ncbi:hypothetical protein HKX41_09305 [Salinisphaera sp. USBA-960]|nr:hypothetical protein [Salifodinibacter halophilus]